MIHYSDSLNVKIPLNEFRFIIGSLIDLNYFKKKDTLNIISISLYEKTIEEKNYILRKNLDNIILLKKEILELQPTYWQENKFYFGYGIGVISTALIIHFLK